MAKINVVNTLGGGAIGTVDANMGMVTNLGIITKINGNLITCGSGTGQIGQAVTDYADKVQILGSNAASWPTGVDVTKFGHGATHQSGSAIAGRSVKATYLNGTGTPQTHTY